MREKTRKGKGGGGVSIWTLTPLAGIEEENRAVAAAKGKRTAKAHHGKLLPRGTQGVAKNLYTCEIDHRNTGLIGNFRSEKQREPSHSSSGGR